MERREMDPPGYPAGQGDADLDITVAASGDRLITAISGSLDLDAGLAEITGASCRAERAGDPDEADVDGMETIGFGETDSRTGAGTPGHRFRAGSPEERYLPGPRKPLCRRIKRLEMQQAAARGRAMAATRRGAELAEKARGERKAKSRGDRWALLPRCSSRR